VSPAGHARTFASALLGDHGEALAGLQLSVSEFRQGQSGPRTSLIPATAESLASTVTRLADRHDIKGLYVGVGLTRGNLAINPATGHRYDRLAKADVYGLAWLWIDIDIAGGGHADSKMPLAADQATALAVAHSTGLDPTVTVDTGHGVQAHWRLAEPFIYGAVDVDDDGAPIIDEARIAADRAVGEQLAYEWVKSLQIRGRRDFGVHVDSTTDPSRLVRLPGSYNRKVPTDVRLVTVLDADPRRVYDLDQVRAVLAPAELLARTRYDAESISGSLAGVDLHALFAQARGFRNFEPDWLAEAIEAGWSPELAAIWSGAADTNYDGDDNRIDMALAATLLHLRYSAADAAQAVMCRRLRIDRKVDKVDPNRRTSYLEMTIGKIAAQIAERDRAAVSHSGSTAAAVEAMMAAPTTEVVADETTSNDNDVSLEVAETELKETAPDVNSAPTNEIPRSLRIAPPGPPVDPREHADPALPPAPRPGLDGTLPAPVTEDRRASADRLAGMLGLPEGIAIWSVGVRRLEDHDEFRVWLHRGADADVLGGDWPPNTVAATRWRPKSDWRARANVAELLLEDLHLVADVQRDWANGDHGRRGLYRLAIKMLEGTPEQVAAMAIMGVLRRQTATALFSTATTYGDPWLSEGMVWVPLPNLRDGYRALGAKAPEMIAMVDLLVDMRCHVVSDMHVAEGHRYVVDERQWVCVHPDLIHADLAANIFTRATDRDAQDARHDMSTVSS